MLEEACGSSNEQCCAQIVYGVRSMFELYTSVVPDYHCDTIENLPQVSGESYTKLFFYPFLLSSLEANGKFEERPRNSVELIQHDTKLASHCI